MQFSRYILTDFISHQWPPQQWNPLITGKPSGKLNKDSGSHLLSHAVTSIVPSADQVLTVVFGMGTGVSPDRIATGNI
jgi:hypothetical protein